MEIKTRFNINDTIYSLFPSGIKHSKIIGFYISSLEPIMLTDGNVFDVPTEIYYKIDNGNLIKEDETFASKKELLEKINKEEDGE